MDDLRGGVAVVTGAASGIGRAVAAAFASEGMRVVMADVERGALDAAADALRATGADVLAVPTDVRSLDAIEALAAATLDRFGAIDVVHNNAGVVSAGAVDELSIDTWRWVLDVDLWSVIYGVRVFAPILKARGRGFQHLLHGLNPERILLASVACGIGEAALRRAVAYAKEREVFGRLIGANQSISHPLAKAHMDLKTAMQMTTLAAWRYDHGLECGEEANTAKYLAAEAAFFAADQAIQTHGGLGYATEYHVERYWREARLQRLAPVSQEMTLNFIAQNVLGLPRSY